MRAMRGRGQESTRSRQKDKLAWELTVFSSMPVRARDRFQQGCGKRGRLSCLRERMESAARDEVLMRVAFCDALSFYFFANARPGLRRNIEECARDIGIKLLSRTAQNFRTSCVDAGSFAVATVRGHGI